MKQILIKLISHNWFAILYFNFKMLPFKQAIKLPFDFYYNVRFENLSGKVVLNTNKVSRGMIKVGGRGSEMFSRNQTIIDLQGTATFNGIVEFGHGCLIKIEKNARITFGNKVRIGALSKVFCKKEIIFEDEIDFSWECQIFDTNFHFIRNLELNKIEERDEPIIIGSYNWFGNRVTVMKGTKTPNYITVASNSLCNKDYTFIPSYSVLGGIPVKLIGTNKERIFE